jgi:hypothetical protein
MDYSKMENQGAKGRQTSQFIENTEVQPEIFPIDATKATSIQELGIIFNALGVGVTEEFAKTFNLEHMVVWPDSKS